MLPCNALFMVASFPLENTVAYCGMELITAYQSFIVQDPALTPAAGLFYD
jgi:hypothetical protein